MLNFKEKQFDCLEHNPFNEDPEETAVLCTIGRLARAMNGIQKFNPEKYRGNAAQYIMYFYDRQTPLRNLYPDVDQRKKQAAILAGFDLEKDKGLLASMFNLTNEPLTNAVISFIRFQNSRAWSGLVANEQLLWETQENLMRRFEEFKDHKQLLDAVKVKTQISETSDKIMTLIAKYEAELFAGDDVARDADAKMRSTGVSPESFAISSDVP